MSNSFNVEVILPSGKSRRINELNNKQYLVIIKFCENKDLFGLSEYFNNIFLDDDLDIIDRFYHIDEVLEIKGGLHPWKDLYFILY